MSSRGAPSEIEINPHPAFAKKMAMALGLAEADIRVIAGVDEDNT